MSRRTSLPGAAELFRTTSAPEPEPEPTPSAHPGVGAVASPREFATPHPVDPDSTAPRPASRSGVRATRRIRAVGDRSPSGRERHDEKITVYCSPEELIDLDTARLHLRADHGLAVDRGRIVREAVAVVLADLEAKGEASILVRRLREP
jgi:hypothetical protein